MAPPPDVISTGVRDDRRPSHASSVSVYSQKSSKRKMSIDSQGRAKVSQV